MTWRSIMLLLLACPAAAAAAAARPVLMLNQLDISKPPAIRVYLTDLDSSQSPITDRKAQHYRLLVDGVPQTSADRLQRFHQLGEAVAVTLIIQVSPALRDALTDSVEASKKLIDALPPNSRVGLIAYTDVVVQEVKPAAPASAKEAIDGLRIRDEALEVQLPDAIKDALEGMDNPGLPRQRMLVVLSDGLTADLNLTVFSELGRRAQDKGVVVHSIGYAPLEPARLRTLHELSKRGGGTMREARDASSVTRAFYALQEEIRNQLVVSYQIPTFFDGKLHDFQIETSGGQASNILPIELPKVLPKSEGKLWYRSVWFLVVMIFIAMNGLILLVVLAFRWRRRPTPTPRERYAADDDEEEEEEEGERGEEEEEPDEDEETNEDRLPDRRPSRPRTGGGKGAPAERADRSATRSGQAESKLATRDRPPKGRLALNIDDDEDDQEEPEEDDSTSVAGSRGGSHAGSRGGSQAGSHAGSQAGPHAGGPHAGSRPKQLGKLGALLEPSPELFDTQPEPSEGDKPPPPGQPGRPAVMGPSAPEQQPRAEGYAMLLPDPQEFLGASRGGAAGQSAASPAELGTGPVRSLGGDSLVLPDPDEFMRQARGEPAGRVGGARSELSASRANPRPDPASLRPPSRELSALRSPSPAVAGSGIPLQAPAVVPAALPPEAGVEPGRFIDRKTKVIAIEELNTADYVAWVVPLNAPPHPAVVVADGFTIGSSPDSNLRLQDPQVMPHHGVLRLDSRGFRVETSGERGETLAQPLSDGDHFFVGTYEFAFKVATRTSTAPLAAARLEVLDGMDMGRKIALPENEVVTIGSHSSCQLVVRGASVEKVHAIAVRSGQLCTLSDLGSATGIGYQGQPVGYRKVRSWEEVIIGTVRVIFILEDFGANEGAEYGDEHHTFDNS